MKKNKEKKEKKPFKETGVFKAIKNVAPDILDTVTDVAASIYPPLGIVNTMVDKALDRAKANNDEETVAILGLAKTEYEKDYRDYLADVQDARDMQKVALGQSSWLAKHYIYLLGTFILVSATGFGVALTFYVVPEENKRLVEMFADIYLFAGAMAVINFFFGSSIGSKEKDKSNS